MKICPKCKNRFTDDTKVCEFCNIELEDAPIGHSKRTKVSKFDVVIGGIIAKLPFKISTKLTKLLLALIAVILAVVILLVVFLPSGEQNYMLFVQDDELMFSFVSDANGKPVSDEVITANSTVLSKDGKKIFYLDKDSNLYFKDVSKLNDEGHKLSSKVSQFFVSDNTSLVTYVETDGDLKQHDLKSESKTIAKDVESVRVSDNGKKILIKQITEDSTIDLLLYVNGKEPEKLVSNIGYLYSVSKDFKSFYFTKNGAVYNYKEGNEKPEKVIKEYSSIVKSYESGEIFYTLNSTNAEGLITESLFYFDGKESKTVSKEYTAYNTQCAVDKPIMIFASAANEQGDVEFYLVSGAEKSALNYKINRIYLEPTGDEIYFVADADATTSEGDLYSAKIKNHELSDVKKVASDVYKGKYLDNDTFVFVADTNTDTRVGELYLNNSDKEIAKNVNLESVYYIPQKDLIIFFSDIKEAAAKLNYYSNNRVTNIDEDVYIGDFYATAAGDIMYIKDFDLNDAEGELYISNTGEGKFVADEVSKIVNVYSDVFKKYVASGYSSYFASTSVSNNDSANFF